jgi:hypothetical protein
MLQGGALTASDAHNQRQARTEALFLGGDLHRDIIAHYDIFREQVAATYPAFGHALRTSCGSPLRAVSTLRDGWRARGGPYQVEGVDSDSSSASSAAARNTRNRD